MMRFSLLLNFGMFSILFLLHIVFAVLDADIAFQMVALTISTQIICFGPLTVILEGAATPLIRRNTNRTAGLCSVPLAVGLAWAYGDMTWQVGPLLVILLLSLSIHFELDRRLGQASSNEG